MPFYRLKMGIVHMKGTRLPDPCRASVWIDGKEARCLAPSEFLCDWPDGGGQTCDQALCPAHARQIGPNRHFCPEHFKDHQQAQGSLFTHLVQKRALS